jgi:hypothetical protein
MNNIVLKSSTFVSDSIKISYILSIRGSIFQEVFEHSSYLYIDMIIISYIIYDMVIINFIELIQ